MLACYFGKNFSSCHVFKGLPYEKRGGLELYVNAEKVGHAIKPLDRPNGGEWNEEPVLSPGAMDRTWRRVAKEPPIAMIGCHRTSNDTEFRDFCRPNTVFDELAIWTRKLEVNRTHNEVLYFTAGYGEMFYSFFSSFSYRTC